jgi:hypothetical protein
MLMSAVLAEVHPRRATGTPRASGRTAGRGLGSPDGCRCRTRSRRRPSNGLELGGVVPPKLRLAVFKLEQLQAALIDAEGAGRQCGGPGDRCSRKWGIAVRGRNRRGRPAELHTQLSWTRSSSSKTVAATSSILAVKGLNEARRRVEQCRQGARRTRANRSIRACSSSAGGLQVGCVFTARRRSAKLSRRCSAARRASAQIVLVGLTTPPVVSALPSTM